MDINDIKRLNVAVEFLKDNMPFSVANFGIRQINFSTIEVNCGSNYYHIENITKTIAREELIEKKEYFKSLIKEAKIFSEYIKNKKIVYNLIVDTGTAGVLICREEDGKLEFAEDIKN